MTAVLAWWSTLEPFARLLILASPLVAGYAYVIVSDR